MKTLIPKMNAERGGGVEGADFDLLNLLAPFETFLVRVKSVNSRITKGIVYDLFGF